MSESEFYVVVGAGHAGGRAVEAMRGAGFAGRIILIGDEPHLPYERPPLSKELLQGRPEAHTPVRDDAFYAENDIDCRLGQRATTLDLDGKIVMLDDGSSVSYDKLLLATGGAVRRLALPGADLANIHYLRTLDDSRAIQGGLGDGKRVVVVGGGFIGLEVAASVRQQGCAVTVLEMADRLMGRAVLPEISAAFLSLHTDQGVNIRLNTGIASFEGDGSVSHAITADGEKIPADMAVVGVGIIPETALAADAGLAVDNGIVVDEFGRTSAPDVYAAGDVTNHLNPLYGRHIRLESWQNAQNQAIAAAKTMCGDTQAYSEVPWMWSDQFDANLQVAGMPESWDRVVFRGNPRSTDFIGFQMAGDRLVGAMSVNRPRDMRVARRLIGGDKPLDDAALADESVSMRDLMR